MENINVYVYIIKFKKEKTTTISTLEKVDKLGNKRNLK